MAPKLTNSIFPSFLLKISVSSFVRQFSKMVNQRLLVAFDFDHTIVHDNSDLVARTLLPSGTIPAHVTEMYKSQGWTVYMQEIFKLLHKEQVTHNTILSTIANIPATKGMVLLLEYLQRPDCEVIIISDSNSLFIDCWLEAANLSGAVAKIYTNPAYIDSNGLLCLSMFHRQDSCDLSEENLCKGIVLENHIKERSTEGITYSNILYVGDGKNDLCPSLRLSETDYIFVREGYSLQKQLITPKGKEIKATVHLWNDAEEIISVIGKILE